MDIYNLQQRQALILNLPCFTNLSNQQAQELAQSLHDISYKAGEIIVKEGELIDAVYVIAQGTAEVTQESTLLATLKAGEAIGLNQLGFFSATGIRTATVTAATEILLLRLSLHDFNLFLQHHPSLNQTMAQAAHIMLQMRLIKNAVPFAHLSSERIRWLADRIKEQTVNTGEILFREGDPGDCCYLIDAGAIQIFTTDEQGQEHTLATLKSSALFGEAALLTTAPRNASARVLQTGRLFVLRKFDLLELIKRESSATNAITHMIMERARPIANSIVSTHQRQTADGETIITLKNPEEGNYYQLSDEGYFVWQQLNGKQTLQDIATAFYKKFGVRASEEIYDLIYQLVEEGFALSPSIRSQINETVLPLWARIMLFIRNIMEAQFAIHNVDAWLTRTYQKGVYLFFTLPGILLLICLAIGGLGSFILCTEHAVTALKTSQHFWLIVIILVFVGNFTVVLHELGHAYATKFYGRCVYRLGVGWYWMGPIAFTDTSDMWLSGPGPRTVVNIAGMFVDCVIAGIAASCIWFIHNPDLIIFLWLFALIHYASVFKNFDPLLEYDGYYVLMDLLEKPNLRESALLWFSQGLPKLLRKPSLWREYVPEIVYWLGCLLFLVLTATVTYLLQHYVIGSLLPASLFGFSTNHLRWFLPLLAVVVSSLGIWAEVRRRQIIGEQ